MERSFFKTVVKILKSGLLYSLLMFAVVVYVFVFGTDNVSGTVSGEQLTMLENSVRRSAVQCYSLEGSYPEDLQYLIDEYGLYYDDKNFVVHYENIGSNLVPQISAFYIGD